VKRKHKQLLEMAPLTELHGLGTESANPNSVGLDTKSALQIARIINEEDQKIAKAVAGQLPAIAKAIEIVAASLSSGGRLIYVGTGTSGRLGALDSSECPPTFNADPEMVQYIIAGGERALAHAVEASEDSAAEGARDMAKKLPSKRDVVLGLAVSGRTPYTIGALAYARKKGAKTIAITGNSGSPITRTAAHSIAVDVGPEVLAGSSRMKAGTMQKMVLNMISTGAFTRMGNVYSNLMVNLHLKNRKLVERGIGIMQQLTGLARDAAVDQLREAGGSLSVALVMLQAGVSRRNAEQRLKRSKGNVRQAIGTPKARKRLIKKV
jgi:N-acetylmuramic acid 6-phosphate etherase